MHTVGRYAGICKGAACHVFVHRRHTAHTRTLGVAVRMVGRRRLGREPARRPAVPSARTTDQSLWRGRSSAGCRPPRSRWPTSTRASRGRTAPTNRSTASCAYQHLSLQWFRNRADAKVSIEAWRRHYNEVRPHSSLGYLTPAAFKAKHLADVDGGRSPAMPARADMTTNAEPLTGPISAILQ